VDPTPTDETEAALQETFESLEPFADITETRGIKVRYPLPDADGAPTDEALTVICNRTTIAPAGQTASFTADKLAVGVSRGEFVHFIQQPGIMADARWGGEIFQRALGQVAGLPDEAWLQEAYLAAVDSTDTPHPDLVEDLLDFAPTPPSEITTRRLLGRCGSGQLLVGEWRTMNETARASMLNLNRHVARRVELTAPDDSAETYTELLDCTRKLQHRKARDPIFLYEPKTIDNNILGPHPRHAEYIFPALANRAGSGANKVVPVHDYSLRKYMGSLQAAVASSVEIIPFTYETPAAFRKK
jgi:hypothetical protein